MIRWLRHDPAALREEEDGAIEFRILAQMFRSEITSSQYWLIRSWLDYLQKEEDLRRDSSIVWSHSLLIPSITFEHFKATLEDDTFTLHFKTMFCYRAFPASTSIYHVGNSHDAHSIIQSGLIPGGKDRQERETCVRFSLRPVNPKFIDHYREKDYDVTKPRIAVY